jgi:hypothetical protein
LRGLSRDLKGLRPAWVIGGPEITLGEKFEKDFAAVYRFGLLTAFTLLTTGGTEAVRHKAYFPKHRYIHNSALARRETSLFEANQADSPAAATTGKRALQVHPGKRSCREDTARVGPLSMLRLTRERGNRGAVCNVAQRTVSETLAAAFRERM